MYKYAYYNGIPVEYEHLNIHISELGLQRGFGVFDYFTAKEGRLPWIEDYLDRFFRSASLAGLDVGASKGEVLQMVKDLMILNDAPNSGFKLICTGGASDDGYTPREGCNFFIINYALFMRREPVSDHGGILTLEEYLRPLPEIKSLFYLHAVLHHKKQKSFGAIDILYYYDDIVYECARSNVFIVENGVVITKERDVLKGITRKQLLPIIQDKYVFKYEDFSVRRLLDADEVFITSSAKGVLPIVRIEDHIISDGKVGIISADVKQKLYKVYSGS